MSHLYASLEIRDGHDTCRSTGLPDFEVDPKSVAQLWYKCHAQSNEVSGRDEIV